MAHRRRFLAGLLSTTVGPPHVWAGGDPPRDQGIGGTGLQAAPPTDSDRGIGGTGVIGTIRRFGSIVVNDLRIGYPADVVVQVDGKPAGLDALRIGQVVSTVATRDGTALTTRAIDVSHEVVGPVDRVDAKSFGVLGQTVVPPRNGAAPSIGDWVAVSGLRRLDGSIVATLVEPTDPGLARIAGPLALAADNAPAVAGLSLTGLDPALVGQRVLIEGTMAGTTFRPSAVVADPERALLANVRSLSIESYAERGANGLRLGSGLVVQGTSSRAIGGGRAILKVGVDSSGALRLQGASPASMPSPKPGGLPSAPPGRAPSAPPGGPSRGSLPTIPGHGLSGGPSHALPTPSGVEHFGGPGPGAAPPSGLLGHGFGPSGGAMEHFGAPGGGGFEHFGGPFIGGFGPGHR